MPCCYLLTTAAEEEQGTSLPLAPMTSGSSAPALQAAPTHPILHTPITHISTCSAALNPLGMSNPDSWAPFPPKWPLPPHNRPSPRYHSADTYTPSTSISGQLTGSSQKDLEPQYFSLQSRRPPLFYSSAGAPEPEVLHRSGRHQWLGCQPPSHAAPAPMQPAVEQQTGNGDPASISPHIHSAFLSFR